MGEQGLDYRSRFLVSKLGIQDPVVRKAVDSLLSGARTLEEEFEAERRKLARERAAVQHRCFVYRINAVSIADSTETEIEFDTEEFDTDEFHDLVTDPERLVIPVRLEGSYVVQVNATFESNGTGFRRLKVIKNGMDLLFRLSTPGISGEPATLAGAFDVDLDVGDYLVMSLFQDSGGSLSLTEPDTETLRPDAIAASTNVTGAVTDIDEDPDSPDANWLTATDETLDDDVRVSFPTPSFTPEGTQEVRAYVRKTSSDTARTETLRPNSTVSTQNVTGGFADVDDDPDSPDANWVEAVTDTAETRIVVGFPTPAYTPEGTVTVRCWMRKTPGASGSGLFELSLFENGSQIQIIKQINGVTNTSGVYVTATFDASQVSNWANVEIRMRGAIIAGLYEASCDFGAVEVAVETAVEPTLDVELWEAGSLVSSLLAGRKITSSTGELVSAEFDASLISAWADVQMKLVGTADADECIDFGAVEINVTAPADASGFPTGMGIFKKSERRAGV